jgi:hypothetical protein
MNLDQNDLHDTYNNITIHTCLNVLKEAKIKKLCHTFSASKAAT